MQSRSSARPRWVAAGLFAIAAAAAASAAVLFGPEPSLRGLREAAPLAALVGGGLGYAVTGDWPRGPFAGLGRAVVAAFVGIVFFCAFYLFADAVIEAARGGEASDAVAAASRRLGDRLPLAIPVTIGAFAAAGVLHWLTGALLRRKTG